jgi:hypothetical protein
MDPLGRVGWKTIPSCPGKMGRHNDHIRFASGGSQQSLSLTHCGFEQVDQGYARVTAGWADISSACNDIWRREAPLPARILTLLAMATASSAEGGGRFEMMALSHSGSKLRLEACYRDRTRN